MEMNWIKTEDQLPEIGQKVIYFFKWTGVHRGIYKKWKFNGLPTEFNCFYGKDGWLCDDVTHWMPDEGQKLPDPLPEHQIDWNGEEP